jgi:RND superfamily putative drug exporter
MLGGISSLQQLGFTVAMGIVMAAGVMATVLVPGLAALLGQAFWWPMRTPDAHTVTQVSPAILLDPFGAIDAPLERAG